MIRTLAPGLLSFVVIAIGLLHLVWAFSPWPWNDRETFVRTVGGTDDGRMPRAVESMLVGVALIGAGALTLMVGGAVPGVGPQWLQLTGMFGFALVMFVRGAGGYLMNSRATPEFRRWNSVLYSPLCLLLCLLALIVAVAAVRR
ncbi:DUF3995 domain-containing protein [Streptomyces ficellus]|uniref:DUF3995 domain-containing protein n=1 Tax=Streptomyces ficellus TaxID=1977088 RepID=A0A6I6F0Y4_9ACTN|nr:DUF3995 domain-containing protein [Streptomyces ficellus]QGV77593.1 DUF3995 domain-containing protein [Streptomyces ficellus]